jgi:pimeloyl-ACP methyl ester carboxylesterase
VDVEHRGDVGGARTRTTLDSARTFSRVIVFDKRGTELSDRVALNEPASLEMRMDDVRTVMDGAGSERAVVFGISEGGPMSMLFAATYPERTLALAIFGSHWCWAPSGPEGWKAQEDELDKIERLWGTEEYARDPPREWAAPSVADDERAVRSLASYLRRARRQRSSAIAPGASSWMRTTHSWERSSRGSAGGRSTRRKLARLPGERLKMGEGRDDVIVPAGREATLRTSTSPPARRVERRLYSSGHSGKPGTDPITELYEGDEASWKETASP